MSERQDVKAPLARAERERLRGLCEAATRAPWRVNAPDWPGGRKVGDDWTIGNLGADEREIAGKFTRSTIYVTTDCVRASEKGGGTAEDDAALIVAARNALPALLDALDAAEARAERAEAFPSRCAFCEARTEATPRAAAEHIATCEKHPLRAAVEENVALRALVNGAHQFVTMGALTHPNPTVQAEASLWLDRCAIAMGWAAEAAAKKEGV